MLDKPKKQRGDGSARGSKNGPENVNGCLVCRNTCISGVSRICEGGCLAHAQIVVLFCACVGGLSVQMHRGMSRVCAEGSQFGTRN